MNSTNDGSDNELQHLKRTLDIAELQECLHLFSCDSVESRSDSEVDANEGDSDDDLLLLPKGGAEEEWQLSHELAYSDGTDKRTQKLETLEKYAMGVKPELLPMLCANDASQSLGRNKLDGKKTGQLNKIVEDSLENMCMCVSV